MQRRVVGSLALVSFAAAGCFVPDNAKPDVGFGATFATRFVHRGMTLVDDAVLQPKLAIGLPTTSGDRIGVEVEANMDLHNDTGDAWFPDGHAGRFTQIEMVASYSKKVGDFDLRGGLHSYNLPNGTEFINSAASRERGGTSEVFLQASTEVLEATPYVLVHYDFDEVRGGYYRAGLSEDIPLGEKLSVGLDGSLGYVSSAQGLWMYALAESGFADLRGELVLKWQYDARTQVRVGVHGSMIVDGTIDAWFNELGANGIDDDPIWFTAGMSWSF